MEEESEDIRIHKLSLMEAQEMVKTGEIADGKTILAILWLRAQGGS